MTHPFDVIKTQRQVSYGHDARIGRLIQTIATTQGYRGFFRGKLRKQEKMIVGLIVVVGVVPRVFKVAPSCAIMISSYEVGKRFFADRRHIALSSAS